MSTSEMVLDRIGKNDLSEFMNLCKTVCDFDAEWFLNEATQAKRYYRGSKEAKKDLRSLQELEARWYQSLEDGQPDFSVYSGIEIVPDIWACWSLFSRAYLKTISSPKSMSPDGIKEDMGAVTSIVDVGCGIGYSTASLKEMFPEANVCATNLVGSVQFDICTALAKQHGFTMHGDVHAMGMKEVDLIFASEYFEHFQNPVEHLVTIIEELHPRFLLIANAFTSISLGHFHEYLHQGRPYDGRAIGKIFNSTLRSYGYSKAKTNCWNNRPTYWRREKCYQDSLFT